MSFLFDIPEISSTLLLLCCSLLFLSFGTYLWFSYIPYQILKKCGINGPSPSFFYGNYKELSKDGLLNYLESITKQYGSIVGFYLGRKPCIVVTDVDLIKLIMVKDFDYFTDRISFPVRIFTAANISTGLVVRKGDDWRQSRRILTPTFSASKMKLMEPLVDNSAKTLVEILEGHAATGKSVEMFRIFGAFTMESILAAAFGRIIAVQKGESSDITKAASIIFGSTEEDNAVPDNLLRTLISNFPFLDPVFQHLVGYTEAVKSVRLMTDTAYEIIRQRRNEESGKHKDLLQLIIDANIEGATGTKQLPSEEIISHSLTFMLGGYETTANALTYTSYLLALNPDVQFKLQEEIDEYFENNPTSSLYQASHDLKYLDMVVNESLRMYSPVPISQRICTKGYRYKDITIPKGANVYIPAYLLHRNPDYWENPDEFNALRFTSEENDKRPHTCFLPFGSGPRNCIGMRFAMMEIKIALIELMKKISFVRSTDTEIPLKMKLGITRSPANGVYIQIASREVS